MSFSIRKYQFLVLFLLLILFVQNIHTVFGITYFNQNMRLGMTGLNVLELQKFLNKSPDTRVASFGPGSLGSETTYFGSLTRNAVIRFQEKYKSEVLIPAGVTQGTGFVGEFTRKKLNSLQITVLIPNPPTSTATTTQITPPPFIPTTPQQATTTNTAIAPHIDSISPTSGIDGTTIVIKGSGFSYSNNTIVSGWGTFYNTPSPDGKTITLTVNSQIPVIGKEFLLPLTYHVYVMNNNQVSNEGLFVLAKESGITYISDAKREEIKQNNQKLITQGGGGSFFSTLFPKAHAQSLLPFGGSILKTEYCNNGILLTIKDPLKGPIDLMFSYGASILFSYYQIYTPGPNTVGNYSIPGVCVIGPKVKAVFGEIVIVGTSLPS